MMFPQSRHSGSSHLPQQLKFTTSDSCDHIKDEFQLLQAQYHSRPDVVLGFSVCRTGAQLVVQALPPIVQEAKAGKQEFKVIVSSIPQAVV
ncbi:hypothetical protein LEMLEM_LOCUS9509 [Lemmus lemmus]